MRILRNLPIRRKLTIIAMFTSGVALLLACITFVTYEQVTYRRTMASELSVLTDLYDDNVAPGLTFDDLKSIETTLNSLKANPNILAAAVYDKAGKPVAMYHRADLRGSFPLPLARETGTHFEKDRLDAFRRIMLAGENIGTIYIASDLRELTARFWRYGMIVSLVLVLSSLVALALLARLQHIISDPISHLAAAANAVAIDRDYSIRAVKHGDDELGQLIDGFNEMLTQIQARDGALQAARHGLEQRVQERTRELEGEIIERQRAEQSVRQNEAQLQTIVENLAEGVAVFDLNGRILHFNRAALAMHGFNTLADSCPHLSEFAGLFDHSDRNGTALPLDRWPLSRILRGENLRELDVRVRHRATGRERVFSYGGSLVHDAAGRPLMAVLTISDITERKRSEAALEKAHKELLETSRMAGMAEVATGVLHNVGNVLNSVNVASSCLAGGIQKSKAANLSKVVALLREHQQDLGDFFTNDPKGRLVPDYLAQLTAHLADERAAALRELALLQKNIEHIKDIVAMQQNYARVSGVTETLTVRELVEDALRMNSSALDRHMVETVREFAEVPPVTVERHKVMQILINLIRNAKYACDESGRADKRMTVRVCHGDGRVKISIVDNGVGIPGENLTRIFNHGFTTREAGHGFGLHSGALAAKQLGGELRAHSDGSGRGATFTLELPTNLTDTHL